MEFLKGICFSLLIKAVITSPREVKLLLINLVSSKSYPSAFDIFTLSDPAKSIKLRVVSIDLANF